jgi:hypothetical protein
MLNYLKSRIPLPGSIVQNFTITKLNRVLITNSDYEDIPDLSLNITPKFNDSKIKIFFSTAIGNTTSTPSQLRLIRNGTPIFVNTNEGDGFFTGNLAGTVTHPISISLNGIEDAPNSLDEIIYKIQAKTGGGNFYIGARGDGNSGSITTFSIQEIKQ